MSLSHTHKRCHCVSVPESSSHPSASVFFGPVLWGRVWVDKALIVHGHKYIYIYVFTTDRKRKDDCVFLDNKEAFFSGAH